MSNNIPTDEQIAGMSEAELDRFLQLAQPPQTAPLPAIPDNQQLAAQALPVEPQNPQEQPLEAAPLPTPSSQPKAPQNAIPSDEEIANMSEAELDSFLNKAQQQPSSNDTNAQGDTIYHPFGIPFNLMAGIRTAFGTPAEIAALIGKVLADKDFMLKDAADRYIQDMAGETDQDIIEQNYNEAFALTKDDTERQILDVGHIASQFAGTPVAGATKGSVRIAMTLDRLGSLVPETVKYVTGKGLEHVGKVVDVGMKPISATANALETGAKVVAKAPVQATKATFNAADRITGGKLKDIASKAVDGAKDIGTTIGGKAVTKVANIGVPAARKLATLAGDYTGEGAAVGSKVHSYEQGVMLATGKYINKLNEIVEPLLKRHLIGKTMPEEVSVSIQHKVRNGIVDAESAPFIKLLNEFGDYLHNRGLIKNKVKNWFPRVYDVAAMKHPEIRQEWMNTLTKYGHTPEEARALYDSILKRDGILVDADTDLARELDGRKVREHGSLNSRRVKVPDSALAPFLKDDTNIYDTLHTYMRRSIQYAEYARRFGANNEKLNAIVREIDLQKRRAAEMPQLFELWSKAKSRLDAAHRARDKAEIKRMENKVLHIERKLSVDSNRRDLKAQKAQLRDAIARAAKEGDDVTVTSLKEQLRDMNKVVPDTGGITQNEYDAIYGLADALLMKYKPLSDTASGRVAFAANRLAVPTIHVLTLPLATLSSISEPATWMLRAAARPTSSLHGFKGIIRNMTHSVPRAVGFKKIPKHEAERSIDELGLGIDSAIMDLQSQLSENRVFNYMHKIDNKFFKLNFLHQWTRAMMIGANETARAMIKGHLKDIAANRGNVELYKKDLAELGIPYEKGLLWLKNGMKRDDPLYEAYIQKGQLKFVLDSVIMPRASQLPLYHSNPRFKLFVTLRSFPTQFGNTVLPRMIKKMLGKDASKTERIAATNAFIISTLLGILSTRLSDEVRYGGIAPNRKNNTTMDWVTLGVDRFGGFGLFSVGRDALTSEKFGRSPATVIAGAPASYAEGFVKAARKYEDDKPKALARWLATVTPVVNINHDVRDSVADTYKDLISDKHVSVVDYMGE